MPPTFPATLRIAVYGDASPDPHWLDAVATSFGRAASVVAAATFADALAALGERAPLTLVLRAGANLPEFLAERLAAALSVCDADVLSPLGNSVAELSPMLEGAAATPADADSIDRGVWLAGDRLVFPSRSFSTTCSLWQGDAIARYLAARPTDASQLPDSILGAVLDHAYVGEHATPLCGPKPPPDPRHPPPASPLATLRARFGPIDSRNPVYAALDPRPVVLHVTHGWGGGVEAFVRDLAEADSDRVHLALVARGETARHRYGEWLELALPAAGFACLRRYPLPRPIAATEDEDAAYRAVLDRIVTEFAIDHVLVSSLIGHTLDALRTGRPTTVVCHDYYPLWPILHADFGDRHMQFDAAALAAALPRAEMPFASRDADRWGALRDAYVAAILRSGATLIAPTQSVRANLRQIEPRLAAVPMEIIAHGFRPFARPASAIEPPPRARPRVLVLGRITAGKGEQLLEMLLGELTREADIYLLGSGKAGERFFGRSGVHVELDYARDRLPEIAARIAPDLALMPVTVAETYSYTLSELWALGIPLVATRLGSLAERIDDGEDGWLADPVPASVLHVVRQRLADHEGRAAMRSHLRAKTMRPLAAMLADYAHILPTRTGPAARYVVEPVAAQQLLHAGLAEYARRTERALDAAGNTVAAQREELAARADWASAQQRLAEDRLRWAHSLETETGRLAEVARERHQAVEAASLKIAELASLRASLEQQREALAQQLATLAEQSRELGEKLSVVLASRSWQLTKPLRFAARRLRALEVSLSFRTRRLAEIGQRGLRSVQSRGVGGTLQRIRRELVVPARGPLELAIPVLEDSPDAPETFAVAGSDTPRVSLVIPVYNQFRHTLTCLKSLSVYPGTVPFEAIVVDDCSTDETSARLPGIAGIRTLRNAQNLGFIGACNAGAALARGEFVVFLNNDTAIQPGWLEALLATFAKFPDCGLAGAKLVYPDARLQEAGGIVFSDGSGWNYGRFGDPGDPQFNYVREADYCSGAAIMIRRELFERFEGFDVRYRPAYYEDTDLAFRVRDAGLKAYYQPAATVVHFEGVTSGTDTGSGIKRYQVVNQQKFAQRWQAALSAQPKPGTPIEIAREHRVRGRVLIVDSYVPEPDQDSGSVRLVNLMQLLTQRGWKVTFAPDNRAYVPRYTADLQQLGVEVLYHPWYRGAIAWLEDHGGILDAVIVLRHYLMASYAPLVRQYAPRARLVFDTVDLHYLREQRLAELNDDAELKRASDRTRSQELRMVRESDVTLVVSPVEQALLQLECPGSRVEVLSNVHQVNGAGAGFEQRRDIWFVGGFQHPPNVDAMQWFVRDVWPLIEGTLPDVMFHIVGSKMPAEITALAGARIITHGHVPDLAPFLDGCRLAVAPLRYGAGVKGKVNQSMAHGQPVVATPIAIEGMHLQPGVEALVAESPQAFAHAVATLYHDRAMWEGLATAGLANVRRHFSFEAASAALDRILPRR